MRRPSAVQEVMGVLCADHLRVTYLLLEDIGRLEAVSRTVRGVLTEGHAWGQCALHALDPRFTLLDPPRCRVRKEAAKSVVTTLRRTTMVDSHVNLKNMEMACALAKAVGHLRVRSERHLAAEGTYAQVMLGSFRFPIEGARVAMAPKGARLTASNGLIVYSPAVAGKDGVLQAWSVQMAWRNTSVLIRAVPMCEGGNDNVARLQSDFVPPVLDIQAVSSAIQLRAHGVQTSATGSWCKVAGLCYTTGTREEASTALGEGLLCVLCVRDARKVNVDDQHAQALNLEFPSEFE